MCCLYHASSIHLCLCYAVKSANVFIKKLRLICSDQSRSYRLGWRMSSTKCRVHSSSWNWPWTLVFRVSRGQCDSSDGNSYYAALVSKKYQKRELEYWRRIYDIFDCWFGNIDIWYFPKKTIFQANQILKSKGFDEMLEKKTNNCPFLFSPQSRVCLDQEWYIRWYYSWWTTYRTMMHSDVVPTETVYV